MKIFVLLARRNRLLFTKENNLFTLPYVEVKEKERIATKIYNFMKEKFGISVTLIIENPWCLAFYKDRYEMLNFIPDFSEEVNSEFLAIPVTSVEEPKDSFWIAINETDNYNILDESSKILASFKKLIGTEQIINEFCG